MKMLKTIWNKYLDVLAKAIKWANNKFINWQQTREAEKKVYKESYNTARIEALKKQAIIDAKQSVKSKPGGSMVDFGKSFKANFESMLDNDMPTKAPKKYKPADFEYKQPKYNEPKKYQEPAVKYDPKKFEDSMFDSIVGSPTKKSKKNPWDNFY